MSAAAVAYDRRMGRWQPDARSRLERSALELFEERGYEQTTVADIAARTGLTERTFFRHFSDKREVLFGGSPVLVARLVEAVAAAPATATATQAVRTALRSTEAFFDGRREHARRRQDVVAANPVLLERELMKMATLTDALGTALRARGVDPQVAALSAEVGVLVFRLGFARWLEEDRPLVELFDDTYAAVGALAPGG